MSSDVIVPVAGILIDICEGSTNSAVTETGITAIEKVAVFPLYHEPPFRVSFIPASVVTINLLRMYPLSGVAVRVTVSPLFAVVLSQVKLPCCPCVQFIRLYVLVLNTTTVSSIPL